nr:wiskott-Aldrich syndrome protein homolog 1-like [Macaca fascicularis]
MSRAPSSPLGPRSYPEVLQTLQSLPRHQVCLYFPTVPPTPPPRRGRPGHLPRGPAAAPPSQSAARTGSLGDPRQSTKTGDEAATQATAAARGWAQSALGGQGRGRQDWEGGSKKWGAEGGAASCQVLRKAPQAPRDAAAPWPPPELTPPAPLPARPALAAAGARASPSSAASCLRLRCAPLCAPRSRRAPGVSKGGQLMGRARIGCSAVSSPPARPPSRPPPPAPAPALGSARCWAPSVDRPTKAQRGGPRVAGPRCAAAVVAAGNSRPPLFV